jgi:hypothetical protein
MDHKGKFSGQKFVIIAPSFIAPFSSAEHRQNFDRFFVQLLIDICGIIHSYFYSQFSMRNQPL